MEENELITAVNKIDEENSKNEKLMIDDFYNHYGVINTNNLQGDKLLVFYTFNPNSRSAPDVSFKIKINDNDEYVILEAKHDNQHNNHNYWKQLFGEILQNRKYYLAKQEKISSNHSFGIFLNYDNEKLSELYTKYLVNNISLDDWNNFGIQYNCKFVFLYDKINHKLYYSEWKDFVKYETDNNNNNIIVAPQIKEYQ